MKKSKLILCLSAFLVLVGCNNTNTSTNTPQTNSNVNEVTTNVSTGGNNSTQKQNTNAPTATVTTQATEKPTVSLDYDEFAKTITAAGSYTLTGEITGSILIDAPEDADVELVFNGVTITSGKNSPIYCKSANELKIKLSEGTQNYIYDTRPQLDPNNEDVNQGKGAIYSKADLKFTSKGSLTIEASYNNGIHSTDDVKLKSSSVNGSQIKVTAINHAVKGNDSITIEDGKILLISKGGSGLKTENTDISSKGNQRGTIAISGGDIEINSCEDAIEAAYNIDITNSPSIKILTSKYSSYTTGSISATTTKSNRLNLSGPGGWGGGGGSADFSDGNTDKASYSAKGLKADNNINISGGTFDIKCWDDTIHASRGTTFANGATGVGNVTISGGTFTLYASDDAIHADYTVDISGGTINVTNCYEGVEGNIINFSGGYTKIYSTDDGLNAANKAGYTPAINVSGGIVDIIVYGGDVDGIDSNGTYSQTGGLVITKGGSGSGPSNALDTDKGTTITGGTLMIFGTAENYPTKGANMTSYTLKGPFAIGNYLVSNGVNEVTVSTKYQYSQVYVYSDEEAHYTVTKI